MNDHGLGSGHAPLDTGEYHAANWLDDYARNGFDRTEAPYVEPTDLSDILEDLLTESEREARRLQRIVLISALVLAFVSALALAL